MKKVTFRSLLSPVEQAAMLDKKLFLQWEAGDITTMECMKQWLVNNKEKENAYITYNLSLSEFEEWLRSLGYGL